MEKPSRHTTMFLAALGCAGALWFLGGGGTTVGKTVDNTLVPPTVVTAGIVLVAMTWMGRGDGIRQALKNAVLDAAAAAWLAVSVLHLVNAGLDGSERVDVQGVARTVEKSRRSPATLPVTLLQGETVRVPASIAMPGCSGGMKAFLRMRTGALGARWVESVRCTL